MRGKNNNLKNPLKFPLLILSQDGNVLYITITNKRCAAEWIFDSGCTYHIYIHRHWFTTYKPLNSDVVLMGDDIQYNVADVDTIQIKTHEGI